MAADAQFRPDLFYRLSVITLELPRCGIEKGTSKFYWDILAQCRGRRKRPFRLTREAARRLRSYPYPEMYASWKMPFVGSRALSQ